MMMSVVLYEHNQKAYDAALSMMNETGKTAVIHPTGTGKSFIGFKLAEQHRNSRICWLSPSEYIFKTQIENLKAVTDGYEPENIDFMTYAKLMVTDIDEIEEMQPDYIILDEFHRCGAAEWGKGVERLLDTYPDVPILGLSATNIRYLDNQRDMADELFDGNIASEMTLGEAIVRNILLPPIYVLSVYAYKKEFDKYRKKADKTKNNIIREKSRKILERLRRAIAEADGLDVVFDKHIKDKSGKGIVFCSSVEHMNEIAGNIYKWFHKINKSLNVYKIYAEDTASDKAFAAFKADESDSLKLLLCVNMLNEGIHVDDVSFLVMFRPTISPIIYKQQLGRALSASKTKEPVVFDVVNNFEGLSSYANIQTEMDAAVNYLYEYGEGKCAVNREFTVIDEVRDCRELFESFNNTLDATWDAYYEAAKAYFEENGHLEIPTTHSYMGLKLGKWLYRQRRIKKGEVHGVLTTEQIEMLEGIGISWDMRSELPWKIGLEHLIEYKETFGNILVPVEYISPDGYKLGQWVSGIRFLKSRKKRRGQLSDEKIQQLNQLGMVWNKFDYNFEINLIEARKYYADNGDLLVPVDFISSNNIKLGRWLASMRSAKRGKNKALLTDERVAKLNSIGMCWNLLDEQWERAFREAEKYFKMNNEISSDAVTVTGFKLGEWIERQKLAFRGYKNIKPLTEEQIKKLESVGVELFAECKTEDNWNIKYEKTLKHFNEYGNVNLPITFVTNEGFKLGEWIYSQRSAYRKGSMSERRIELLEKIGVVFDIKSNGDIWEERYEVLKEYYDMHGSINNIPYSYITENNVKLGEWLKRQKKIYRGTQSGNLSKEKISKLEALGIKWDNAYDALFDENFMEAKAFFKEKGHLRVPSKFLGKNGQRLDIWIITQRKRRKQGIMTEEQEKRLSEIGMEWELKDLWDDFYSALKDFVKINGHVSVPHEYLTPEGNKLYPWLYHQKIKYKNAVLDEEKTKKLEALGIEFSTDKPIVNEEHRMTQSKYIATQL